MLNRKVVPHIDDAGEFCIVNRQMYIFDRYRAAEQTLGLILRASEILERGMTRAGTDEIAAEFPSYWAEKFVELPDPKDKAAAAGAILAHLSTAAHLSFEAHQKKPKNLGELLDWAKFWDDGLATRIMSALSRLSASDPAVAIHAPNGTIVAQLLVSSRGASFIKTFGRPGSWAKFLNMSAARAIPIDRLRGENIDLSRIFGASGPDGKAPLAGRTIVQIGCGAIGGYLSRMLVQMGAGIEAPMTLIDPDQLSRSNVRRHQLGFADLSRSKAVAVADAIGRDFPVKINAITGNAQKHCDTLAGADLVIDATGEQEFAEWLNAWALARREAGLACPAILYVWIAGFGAAAQSFLSLDNSLACYRCLQPDHGKPARFDPLREPMPEPVGTCGEQPITPYGPAASTAAASLAASHAGDWARGRPHHLLRTTRIDWEATVKRDPKSPERAPDCPACRTL